MNNSSYAQDARTIVYTGSLSRTFKCTIVIIIAIFVTVITKTPFDVRTVIFMTSQIKILIGNIVALIRLLSGGNDVFVHPYANS